MVNPDSQPAVTVIHARRGWAGIGIRELLGYHELLYFLIWRDLRVRYDQTALGVAWALIQPLAMMFILTLFLGRLEGLQSQDIPYPLFVLAGLVPWTLFAQGVGAAGNSLVESAALLTKVYFPRLIFPLAAAGSHVVDFGIGAVLLAAFAAILGFPPQWTWLIVLPLALLAFLAAVAVGLWLSALNVRYRDFRYATPFLIQLWFFATPIAYSADAVPESVRGLLALNPMASVVEGIRWGITGGTSTALTGAVFVGTFSTIVILMGGLAFFRRAERTFADVI
jgi:lipopolysaccharide transport system permease protein